jgi:hypothetical protein
VKQKPASKGASPILPVAAKGVSVEGSLYPDLVRLPRADFCHDERRVRIRCKWIYGGFSAVSVRLSHARFFRCFVADKRVSPQRGFIKLTINQREVAFTRTPFPDKGAEIPRSLKTR